MILDELKTATDIIPDEHDGSYELVRETVKSLATVPIDQIDVNDLDMLYSMAIGTWKIGVDKKLKRIKESNLRDIEKTKLSAVLEKVKNKSIQHYYKDNVEIKDNEWFIGMFGTGFQTFQSKADKNSAQRFINLCIDLLNMEDAIAMFVKVDEVFSQGIKGMQSAAASVVLHCLKPTIFPIINSGIDNTIIKEFREIGVPLIKPKELKTYIKNSKLLMKFRDDNCSYKNYRVMDLMMFNDTEDLSISNAKFIKWFAPLISALKQLNGQGTPSEVCKIIAENLSLDEEFVNQKGGKLNQNIYKNQVAWARQYLKLAGLLDGSERGLWKLTDAGFKVEMTNKLATEILKNKDIIDKPVEPLNEPSSNYWWLNANPNEWSFSNIEIGQSIDFTSSNENGNKRQIFKSFEDAKVGDIVIGYESGSTKAIVAICKISKEHDGERIGVEKVKNLVIPIKWQELIETEEFKNKKFQGTLFKLTLDEYNAIFDLIVNEVPPNILESYSEQDFLDEVFITPDQYNEIKFLLKNKKNIILQGAPGVGKTFAAKRLACSLMGCKDNSRIEMVQFHQNYSYEDFVMGYRPVDGSGFELRNGCFHNFCIKASNDPEKEYYFIIDEINRGNLSKIFGELLMLIECDKRGISYAVPLTYKPDSRFYVPENVHIIGMMNTADRSLAMIDYALRRRFCFIEMEPAFQSKQFEEHLKSEDVETVLIDKIIKQMSELNKVIEQDSNLGKGFRIGHSYFCSPGDNADVNWYKNVIKYEIVPLLEEYWFDNDDEVKKHKTNLQG